MMQHGIHTPQSRPAGAHLLRWVMAPITASETAVMLTSSLTVGTVAGLGIVLFHEAVRYATLLLSASWASAPPPSRLYILLLPALGGLLVGLWLRALKPQGPGQGVAGIMEAVAYHGGRVDLRCTVARVAGAIITLATGGSAGPEDPSVQLGAAAGSQIGRLFRLSEARVRTLVACGAAAAVAAAFKAPVSGVFFAVEIILDEFSSYAMTFVILAAVAGAAISQSLLGNSPAFAVPPYELRSPAELLGYQVLGAGAAGVGVVYVRLLHRTEAFFEEWRFPDWLKPALGGLLVGALAYLGRPEILGIGYEALGVALSGAAAVAWPFFALLALKLVATAITIGSGGQGGLFAPSLFLGGMLGLGLGTWANAILPGISAPPAAYGLVAMGAVLASAVRAPILAILLPFEMTNDHRIILPLMLAVVTSYLVARRLEPESVYTLKLRARGVDLSARKDMHIMRAITVGEAMTREFPTVPASMSLAALADLFHQTGHHGFPVLGERGELAGVVTLEDYERAMRKGQVEAGVAAICTRDPITAFPDETLEEVLLRFGEHEVGRVPVVERRDPTCLAGILRRSDITRAYSLAVAKRAQVRQRMALARAGADGAGTLAEVEVTPGAAWEGRMIRELALPGDCLLVSVKRGRKILIPHGDTTLQAGDRVTALVSPQCQADLADVLTRHER